MLKKPLCIDVWPGQELDDQRLTFIVDLLALGINISGQTCFAPGQLRVAGTCVPQRGPSLGYTHNPSLPGSCLLSCLYWSLPALMDPNPGVSSLWGVERMEGPGLS